MTEVGGLQEHVTRNVRVLMAIGEIRTQVQLAAALGLDRTTLAGRFSGKAGWKLEELADLGRVFNVTPAALLGDTAQLVGAVGPAKAAGGSGGSSPTGP
ncbi:Cro/C1-type HTH DNA-binding domain-containing protein [Amycolatopsis tolypomycina]|uniref:Cro/C1-type HTH DNA-binding domain-containing protein n=1 Tax=Amycolatopsis tolypomycina TaxID=208445 RepID=A0A1H4JAG3_9PSEU|nr:helix-turn-helix transcriptional regulator [Amycolatopsis tolypomycina]SEB43147.1 Cro/C1-type HTH DNA-binding domain-containing protein [Amycolatopsis tolypomycina]